MNMAETSILLKKLTSGEFKEIPNQSVANSPQLTGRKLPPIGGASPLTTSKQGPKIDHPSMRNILAGTPRGPSTILAQEESVSFGKTIDIGKSELSSDSSLSSESADDYSNPRSITASKENQGDFEVSEDEIFESFVEPPDPDIKLESALNYKEKYLNKYGVNFNIPSLYVQSAAWYPKDPSYFIQIVNYVVPRGQQFDVQTHFIESDKPMQCSTFESIFSDKIQGCIIRLIKTHDKLNSIKLIDQFAFKEVPRIDKLDIDFSADGKILTLFSTENNFIRVYEFKSIEKVLDSIRANNHIVQIKDTEGLEEVSFGKLSKFMIVKYQKKIQIFHIAKMCQFKQKYEPEGFNLPTGKFEKILDFFFQANQWNDQYVCYIACKVVGLKKIKVFSYEDMHSEKIWENESNSINYFHETSGNQMIKMNVNTCSHHNDINVVFVNDKEQFTISMNEKGTNQMKLTQLGSKKIQFIVQDKRSNSHFNCFLFACNDYDEYLHVFKADDIEFHLKISRNIQPNIIRVFDVIVTDNSSMKVLSLKDDEFIIDQIETEVSENEIKKANTYIFSSVRAFSLHWPYICFSGLENFLMVCNLYDQKVLHRVQMAPQDENVQVCQTFITNTKDLFLVIKKQETYQILMLDLDEINAMERQIDENAYKFQVVSEYPISLVGNGSLSSLFIRGSSRKEMIQLNQKLLIFLLYETELFAWVESKSCGGRSQLVKVEINPNRQIVQRDLIKKDGNSFYFLQKSTFESEHISEICQVQINFSTFTTSLVTIENSQQQEVIGFNLDKENDMLMILSREIKSVLKFKDSVFIKIKDLKEKDDIILEQEILDENMKGILISGQYQLINGHIYFNNNVIKIRYDLIKQLVAKKSNFDIYFNQYSEILKLNKGETVKTNSPIDNYQGHRFGYVVLNNQSLQPKKLMVLPYLHERKIYLNRLKQNTDYFYTSKQSSSNTQIYAFNLTESKYYIYSEKGILLKRTDYSDFTKKYGEVVCISDDGLNFLLLNKIRDQLTVLRFNEHKVLPLKSFFINESISKLAKKQTKALWIQNNSEKFYHFDINNKADITIRVTQAKSQETIFYFQANYKIKKNLLPGVVNQAFKKVCKEDARADKPSEQLIVDPIRKKFQMTLEKLFLWDQNKIEYYNLSSEFTEENRKLLGFEISKIEPSFIRNVATRESSDIVAIVIEQIQGCTILAWSVKLDQEVKAFEVDKKHQIIWDQNGSFLIIQAKSTTIGEQNVSLRCFHIDNFDSFEKDLISYEQGQRFDYLNHNWVLMKQYLCFSFSYMTFVIQEKIEGIDFKAPCSHPLLEQAFDIEAFTYMLNRNSCFTSGSLTQGNYIKFKKILEKLSSIDPGYLEILHYTCEEKITKVKPVMQFALFSEIRRLMTGAPKKTLVIKSALQQAYDGGNNRVVDIILKHMAYIHIDKSDAFKAVLPNLTDLQSFGIYMERLLIETEQLRDMKVLRIKNQLNNSIVAMASCKTAFIDEFFYQTAFHQDKTNKNYKAFPVNIVIVKIDWIISTPEGKAFLLAIHQSERLDFYKIRSLQIIIEFLYQQIKSKVLNNLLPLAIIQGVWFCADIILQEMRENYRKDPTEDYWLEEDQMRKLNLFIVVMNQIQTIIMVVIMIRTYFLAARNYFDRVYTWFDIMFYTLNTIANQFAFYPENYIEVQRILQAFCIICFLGKNFYYMSLIDQIAPLIDIIIRIFFDIKWFLFIFVCCLVSFGLAFYLLGANQLEFDEIEDEELHKIKYGSLMSSFLFVWDIAIGGGSTIGFSLGNGTQNMYLSALNLLAQFTLLIHFLNMLIAIMGDTFGQRNLVADQVKMKDHLAFIIDNWYLKDYSLGDISQIKYIITAFHIDDSSAGNERIEHLQSTLEEVKEKLVQEQVDSNERFKKMEMNQTRQELILVEILKETQKYKELRSKVGEISKVITKTDDQEKGEKLRKIVLRNQTQDDFGAGGPNNPIINFMRNDSKKRSSNLPSDLNLSSEMSEIQEFEGEDQQSSPEAVAEQF